MSRLDGLGLDADGYLDMDAFPVDAPDLPEADVLDLRAALLADPVDEPSADEWTDLIDLAVDPDPALDTGPFSLADGSVDLDAALAGGDDLLALGAVDPAADLDDAAGIDGADPDPLDADLDPGDDWADGSALDGDVGGLVTDPVDLAGGDAPFLDADVAHVVDDPLPDVAPDLGDHL